MPKCNGCKKQLKAKNCQNCFYELKNNYWRFMNHLIEATLIHHLSSLDKIRKFCFNKKEKIRNYPNERDNYEDKKNDKI